ncbi:MAG: pitrilysin family protein [Nitrospirota bacterium]|jgi:zinc protease
MFHALTLTLAALFAMPAAHGEDLILPVQEHRLANGLRVVTLEDHSAPVAILQVWYHVGSKNEVPGKTGLAHLLEHMMFKGTATLGPGEFSRRVASGGGDDNAFTSRDYTAYFEKFAADRLSLGLRLEADRMRGLRLDPVEFDRERAVVKEERRMRTEDDPQAALVEQVHAAAFVAHPYRGPVIGWMADLDRVTVADLKAFYDYYYQPGNAVLVLVGDFDTSAVLEEVEATFGRIPAGPPPAEPDFSEPRQRGERRIVLRREAQLPFIYVAYHTPTLDHRDGHALEVLAQLLSGGKSARLYQSLVQERQVALYTGASYDSDAEDPALFTVYGAIQPGHTTDEWQGLVATELQRLATEPVPERELTKAKNQIEAQFVFAQDSIFYLAMTLGRLYTTGRGIDDLNTYLARIRAVTAADVQRVARTYFQPDQHTVGILIPERATTGDGGA